MDLSPLRYINIYTGLSGHFSMYEDQATQFLETDCQTTCKNHLILVMKASCRTNHMLWKSQIQSRLKVIQTTV